MKYMLLSVLVFVSLFYNVYGVSSSSSSSSSSLYTSGSIYYNSGNETYSIELNKIDKNNAVAYGFFNDTLLLNGWGVFQVNTNSKYEDNVQMFAAGFLEGYLTWIRLQQTARNMRDFYFPGTKEPSQKLLQWLKEQDIWTRDMVNSNLNDPFWSQTGYIMSQFDGLRTGFDTICKLQPTSDPCHQVNFFDFQLLQDTGDFLDLQSAISEEPPINWLNMTRNEFELAVNLRSLCSGLIKVTYDLSDLFAAHSAWFTYGNMNRIYKTYGFDLSASFVAAKVMSFSSYPGFLVSLDDFYQMDSGLAMVQTTNSVFNHSLYQYVKPQSLLAWQRVRIANSMARTGKDWYELVKRENSGTYNNQYMVVNYNLFKPGQPLVDNTLWVIEQIPGLVMGADLTHELERGYFPSYNIPYFETIYNLSGYPAVVEKYGPRQSYDLAPRAQIFRRDQNSVTDLNSLKNIMRYNNYKNDPISEGSPWAAICSRGDLASPPSTNGCYDSKVANYESFKSLTSYAINGPTTGTNLKPFQWISAFNDTDHFGQPNLFDFDFVQMSPSPVIF